MRRLVPILSMAVLAVATLVWAQTPARAKLRSASGERPVTAIQQGSVSYFPVDEVVSAFGGKVARDPEGFKASLKGVDISFATDSRYAIIRDGLVELPEAPILIDNRPYVPWQFFQSYFRAAIGMDVSWDPAALILEVKPLARTVVSAQASVVDLEGVTKIVIQLSDRAEYSIEREAGYYIVRLRSNLRAASPEVPVENPLVSRIEFREDQVRIALKTDQISANSYQLENPFRIVIDMQHGVAPAPGNLPPAMKIGPADLPGIRTIVIDPGHGGKEVGAIGPAGLQEKDITLAIARRLAGVLERRLNARVVLTRTGDELITLDDRTSIANQYKADLFVSIHLNASVVRDARGTETYFLSLDASDELARKAADRENASAVNTPSTGGVSDLRMILWDLAQQEYLKESSRLAELIQDEMNVLAGIQSRGVKQAPFKVLVGATMPAALVEVGFVSNPEEEAKLGSEEFQARIAETLASAIDRYKNEYEVRIGIAEPKPSPPSASPSPAVPAAATAARAQAPGV
jgi:N-acetylmuramoyl-L-alanine amidase